MNFPIRVKILIKKINSQWKKNLIHILTIHNIRNRNTHNTDNNENKSTNNSNKKSKRLKLRSTIQTVLLHLLLKYKELVIKTGLIRTRHIIMLITSSLLTINLRKNTIRINQSFLKQQAARNSNTTNTHLNHIKISITSTESLERKIHERKKKQIGKASKIIISKKQWVPMI